jgi:hypothetical protein
VGDDAGLVRVQGSCAGFEVHSSRTLQTLRTGGGSPLYVDFEPDLAGEGELIMRWHPRPQNPFHGRLLRDGRTYAFWASDAGWYLIEPDVPRIATSADEASLKSELRLFGVPATLCALELGDFAVHAAAVEIDGRGVLLAGPSRFGKTTLAAAFASVGHRLLTEDMTRCSTKYGPAVFPGPAAVRLRSDVAGAINLVKSRRVALDDDRVYHVLEPAERGSGSPVPLQAILFLRDAVDAPELRSLAAVDAIRDLWALTLTLPGDASTRASFERLVDLVTRVECLELRRELSIDQLPAVIELVEHHLRPAG